MLVYFRPKYKQHRRQHPTVGRVRTFLKVVFPLGDCCRSGRKRFEFTYGTKSKTAEESNANEVSSPDGNVESRNEEGGTSSDVEAGVEQWQDNEAGEPDGDATQ